jgi:RND superfamily putative drug exporter
MFSALARLAINRYRIVLVSTALIVVLAAFAGIHAFGALKSGGFVPPNASSQIAANKLNDDFAGPPDFILLVHARSGTVDSPAVVAAGQAVTARLAATSGVEGVQSYWSTGSPSLKSKSGTEALVVGTVNGSDKHVTNEVKDLAHEFASHNNVVTVTPGGAVYVGNSIGTQIQKDLAKAEGFAIPLTLLFLILAFGSMVAAVLPVAIGAISIFTTLAVLWALAQVTNVSVYALNLTTALSLGLAIDYSLLMISRYREELALGRSTNEAVSIALARAGRTIVFSAATVAAAMAVLLVFPVYFLRSFAYAGISVVVLATIGALVVLPSLLVALGPRIDRWQVPIGGGRVHAGGESPFWHRVGTTVMSRPLVTALPIVAILIVLAVPFSHVKFGTPDDRVIAPGSTYRVVGDALRTQFTTDAATTTDIVTSRPLTAAEAISYSQSISALNGVQTVTGPAGTWVNGNQVAPASSASARYQSPQGSWFTASTPDPLSHRAQNLVRTIRAVAVPGGATAYVGGQAASLVDQKDALSSRLPLALGLIVLTTFLVLWLFTDSVVLPIKALVLNALVLCSVLGVMIWIFQYGHLRNFFDFTPLPTSTTMPLLVFCIAFGLSMDYEVFVLSRIKELHDAGVPNREAVVGGLARTGRIVTTAAALMAITFFSFAVSKVSFIQMFALATGTAILLDATVIRGVLVPAFMRVAGDWNWWSPGFLHRLHHRIGIGEVPEVPEPELVLTGSRS